MVDYLELTTHVQEQRVRSDRKAFTTMFCLVIFSASFSIVNYFLIEGSENSFASGWLAINPFFWSLMFCVDNFMDYLQSKKWLRELHNMKTKEIINHNNLAQQ